LKKINFILIFILFFHYINIAISQNYFTAKPKKGMGLNSFLKEYLLEPNKFNIDKFKEINPDFQKQDKLLLNKEYNLPVIIYKFNNKSIRTTLGIKDFNKTKEVENFNKKLLQKKIINSLYTKSLKLYVPIELLNNDTKKSIMKETHRKKNIIEPLFGEKYKNVKINNYKLENCIFYLISGHGGPDPGAIGYKDGKELTEDEYAYDVILRLGRKLIENGADVYFIVQDSTDGIRDYKFLNNSTNEKHFGNLPIPNDQLERLSNRVKIVNSLYETNFSDNLKQFAIEIHIDSRSERKNIDIFFYHKEGDTLGLNLAETIRKTIDKKYSKAQPGRGYEGTLSSRNLYMVRNLKPTTVFIEIGNIQNPKDQKRIIEPNNRQAIANWITDGILNYFIKN